MTSIFVPKPQMLYRGQRVVDVMFIKIPIEKAVLLRYARTCEYYTMVRYVR